MNRSLIVASCLALACVTALVPVALCAYFAQADARQRDQDSLNAFADEALARAEQVLRQATEAVNEMEDLRELRCSPAHLEQVRRIAFYWRYVQDAGIYGDGAYLCSALLGAVGDRHLQLPPPVWRGKNGFVAWPRLDNPFGAARESMLIGRNGNFVSVDPLSIVDVNDHRSHWLAAINPDTGVVFAVTPGADPERMSAVWRRGADAAKKDELYVVRSSPEFPIAIVAEARVRHSLANWKTLLAAWLAGGVVFGLVLGLLVWRVLSYQFSLRAQLRRAVRRREFVARYQPIVSLESGRCVGAEALVRWVHNGRMVPPDQFIPLAEEEGLIQSITDQVLAIVIDELGEVLRRNPALYVSINVSAQDLGTRRFLDVLQAKLEGTGIGHGQIPIEVTESSFMHADAARDVIRAFRDAGHPVYIDDFGTGYSSLAYLQNFEVDVLKIDKCFVDTIGQDAASSRVAPHIIGMAHALGIAVVAEGIERVDQAALLRQDGAQFGQGWLFAKPMKAREWMQYLGEDRRCRREPPAWAAV